MKLPKTVDSKMVGRNRRFCKVRVAGLRGSILGLSNLSYLLAILLKDKDIKISLYHKDIK